MRSQDFESPLWQLTPFIDLMDDGTLYNFKFDWEREWRVPGGLRFRRNEVAFVFTPGGMVGDLSSVVQDWNLGVLLSRGRIAHIGAAAQKLLGDELDHWVARFEMSFVDPVHLLSWDSEEGYIWLTEKWDTGDAVDSLFDDLDQADLDALISELDSTSSEWVSLEQWESIRR